MEKKCKNCKKKFNDKFYDLIHKKHPDIPLRIYCDVCIDKLYGKLK